MNHMARLISLIFLVLFLFCTLCCNKSGSEKLLPIPADADYKNSQLPAEERTADLLSRMSLNEKLGQMVCIERRYLRKNGDITEYLAGSILSGGGSVPDPNTVESWQNMYDNYQKMALDTRCGIPIIYGIDAVHGFNALPGATIFPHNIGLGATRDPVLVKEIGRVTALETAATGIDWDFAPCIAAPQDERWGRIYEGYSEYTPLVAELGAAYIRGLQAGDMQGSGLQTSGLQGKDPESDPARIAACAKHFAGDGGTFKGTDRGDVHLSDEDFRRIHIDQYKDAVKAGVSTIMISFSSLNSERMHGNRKYITDILKGEMGFSGFVVSDWGGIDHVAVRYKDCLKQGINAGIDMVMIPDRYEEFLITMKALVETGDISLSRIDDAVTRILNVKFGYGLFEHPFADRSLTHFVAAAEHKALARKAVQKSLVLLKNRSRLLPLRKNLRKIFVAGKSASDVGIQCGGWTITWQGITGEEIPGTTILDGIREKVSKQTIVAYDPEGKGASGSDAAIVVVGELPYAEFRGDKENLALSVIDADAISQCINAGVPTIVVIISGRPMIITGHINQWDAAIAAWLPGSEGGGVADLIFGDCKPTGKLSYTWPKHMNQIPINYGDTPYDPLFPYGYGLSY